MVSGVPSKRLQPHLDLFAPFTIDCLRAHKIILSWTFLTNHSKEDLVSNIDICENNFLGAQKIIVSWN